MARIESDSYGKVRIPDNMYYGIVTEKTKDYNLSGHLMPRDFIKALGMIKKAYTITHINKGQISNKKGRAFLSACNKVIKGSVDDHFILDVFQAGTSFDSCVNEIISNLAIETLGGKPGDYSLVGTENTMLSQSQNMIVTAAMKMTLLKQMGDLLKELSLNIKYFHAKSAKYRQELKSSRFQLKNANPLTYGQLFGTYSSELTGRHGELSANRIDLMRIGTSKEVVRELKKSTGYAFQFRHEGASWDMSVFQALSRSMQKLATSLLHITDDINNMNASSEMVLPYLKFGNSKVNSVAEYIAMACHNVEGNDFAISRSLENETLDLNATAPFILFNLTESIERLTKSLALSRELVNKMKLNEKRMTQHDIDVSIATALGPYLGMEMVSEIMRLSIKKGLPVKDYILARRILTEKDFLALMERKRIVRPRFFDSKLAMKIRKNKGFKTFQRQICRK